MTVEEMDRLKPGDLLWFTNEEGDFRYRTFYLVLESPLVGRVKILPLKPKACISPADWDIDTSFFPSFRGTLRHCRRVA